LIALNEVTSLKSLCIIYQDLISSILFYDYLQEFF
jgi:hypothetical protein